MAKKKSLVRRSPERARFLKFVRTEQTFEEARRMLERVNKELAHSAMKPWAARLLQQVESFKKGMREEEGRLEVLAQKARG